MDEQLQGQEPEVVVIFSPNHFHTESNMITTADSLTGYPVNKEVVKLLTVNFPDVTLNDILIDKEHGITALLPYLKNSFPDAVYLPLAFSPHYDPYRIENIAKFLSDTLPKNTLFVAAIDFSHNSSLAMGLNKNKESIKTITNFDHQTLYSYRDDHLDSPVAMSTFLHVLQKRGATKWEVWHNTHAAQIIDNPNLQGTSYVIGVFRSD